MSQPSDKTHLEHLSVALSHARNCTATRTAFCVGALIVSDSTNTVLASGYSRELPGNTHAEQNCLTKLLLLPPPQNAPSSERCQQQQQQQQLDEAAETGAERREEGKEEAYSLYTTMEPCSERLSGNIPCTDSILRYNESAERRARGLGRIGTVYVGVREPETFVRRNVAHEKLLAGGVRYVHVSGLEAEVLEVARRGHDGDDD